MRKSLKEATDRFYYILPYDATISDDTARSFIANCNKDIEHFNNNMQDEMFNPAKSIYAKIGQALEAELQKKGSLSKEDFSTICHKIREGVQPVIAPQEMGLEPAGDGYQINRKNVNVNKIYETLGITEALNMAQQNFAFAYASEHKPQLNAYYSMAVDEALELGLEKEGRQRGWHAHSTSTLDDYIDSKVAFKNSNPEFKKEAADISAVLNKLLAYHSMVYFDLSGVDLSHIPDHNDETYRPYMEKLEPRIKEKSTTGKHAQAVAVIDKFLDGIATLPPEERTPLALDTKFMKALKDGLPATEYTTLTREFTKRVNKRVNERIAKGEDDLKDFTKQRQ